MNISQDLILRYHLHIHDLFFGVGLDIKESRFTTIPSFLPHFLKKFFLKFLPNSYYIPSHLIGLIDFLVPVFGCMTKLYWTNKHPLISII